MKIKMKKSLKLLRKELIHNLKKAKTDEQLLKELMCIMELKEMVTLCLLANKLATKMEEIEEKQKNEKENK